MRSFNQQLAMQIVQSCQNYLDHKISVADLQASLEENGAQLDGVDRAIYVKLHDFSNELEKIQHACLEEEQYAQTCLVIQRLRDYLHSLPFPHAQ